MIQCVAQTVRLAPEMLATAAEGDNVISLVGRFIDAPRDLLRSVVLRQSLAEILLDPCTRLDRFGRRPAGCDALLAKVYRNSLCHQHLMVGLIKLFVDVGYVEETVDVFDKNQARTRVGEVLKEFIQVQRFRTEFQALCAQNDLFHPFALALLSDATFLLNDSLGRLSDVQGMQRQMADKEKWNSNPPTVRAEVG